MSHILLIGFMGSGKSTVGRIVSELTGLPFVDLDESIAEREGDSIPAIFAERGEDSFRCLETDALDSLAALPDSVIACGGGIVLTDDNRARLSLLGRVVYLRVSAEEALARIGDTGGRPLLADGSARKAATLLEARRPLYASVADVTVETSGRSAGDVASEVVAALRTAPAAEETIAVAVPGAEYGISIGRGVLRVAGHHVRRAAPDARRAALVTDETVGGLFGGEAVASMRAAGIEPVSVVVPAGEGSKSWERAGEVLSTMAAARLERPDVVVALGGGVVGDLGGFCAAVYLRGVRLVHVPTTLLAQVDSSIGGKTGVDLTAGKNLAGAFLQPSAVVTDTALLGSLPEAEWASGLAEVAKTAFLAGGEVLEAIERDAEALRGRDASAALRAVRACAAFKAAVVSADERETGRRECLNLGHTLGHALEKVAGYGAIPHGAAVAEGMRFAAALAESAGLASPDWTARQEALMAAMGLLRVCGSFDTAALRETMASDKKARGGRVRFAFAAAPGVCEVHEVADDVLSAGLEKWAAAAGERG